MDSSTSHLVCRSKPNASYINVSEPYKKELLCRKSSSIYEKWWQRYQKYAEDRNTKIEDVTTFMNWLCALKEIDGFSPNTIITAASCANSRIKLNYNENFMQHMLVKDIIKKLDRRHVPKQEAVFTREDVDNFVFNGPDSNA